jgi:4-aminobutyrate aminotransferase
MNLTATHDAYPTSPLIKTALPGRRAREVLARDNAVTSPSLPRAYPLVPQRGRGSSVEDVDGNVFLDFNAGIAVNSTGHAHPKVVEAVQRQAGRCTAAESWLAPTPSWPFPPQ